MSRSRVLSALLLVAMAAVWIRFHGVKIEAAPGAFARRPGSPLLERAGGTHLRLDAVPDRTPGWIRAAARLGIPVVVAVPVQGRVFEFTLSGLAPGGELRAPCKTAAECTGILEALGLPAPPEPSAAP